MQRLGLYYPYVHFASDHWVKAAALYWPRMARMVPPSFVAVDSTTVQELRAGLDFVVDLDPSKTVKRVARLMVEVVQANLDELAARYQIATWDQVGYRNRQTVPAPLLTPVDEGGAAATSLGRPVSQYRDVQWTEGIGWVPLRPADSGYLELTGRMDAGVVFPAGPSGHPPAARQSRNRRVAVPVEHRSYPGHEQLTELPAARPISDRAGLVGLHAHETTRDLRRLLTGNLLAVEGTHDWIAVHPGLAWVYLCTLAAEVATRNRLHAVTDEPAGHLAIDRWDTDRITAALLETVPSVGGRDVLSTAAVLALPVVVPDGLDRVPAAKIVQLRRRYGADFDAFHDALTGLAMDVVEQLGDTAAAAVVEAYLANEVRVRFEQPVQELKRAMRGLHLDTAFAAASLRLELPAAAMVGGGLAIGQPIVAGVGAAAFAALGLVRSNRRARAAARTPSPASYLLRVDRELTPRNLVDRLRFRV